MAWQRTGCSHDGGTNVLGQMPVDYASVSPRGKGMVGDTTYQRGGGGFTSPRGGADQDYTSPRRGPGGNQTDRGGNTQGSIE